MKLRLFSLIPLLVLASYSSHAQTGPAPTSVSLSDPWLFFGQMYGRRLASARGEFETKAEYEARVPTWPKDRIIYFAVPQYAGNKPYKYNPDTSMATVFGGVPESLNSTRVTSISGFGFGILLDYRMGKTTHYEAQNAFGVKARVKASGHTNLVLVPSNHERLVELGFLKDDLLDTDACFRASFKLDLNNAKATLADMELVIGVTFENYRSAIEGDMDESKPTIDDPNHTFTGSLGFIGTVKRVLIRNRKDNKIWKTFVIPEESKPLASAPGTALPPMKEGSSAKPATPVSALTGTRANSGSDIEPEPALPPASARLGGLASSGDRPTRRRRSLDLADSSGEVASPGRTGSETIPNAASPVDIPDVSRWLDDFFARPLPKPKGEFETTEDYQKRASEHTSSQTLFRLTFDPSVARTKPYSYNADTQTMRVYGGRYYDTGQLILKSSAQSNGLNLDSLKMDIPTAFTNKADNQVIWVDHGFTDGLALNFKLSRETAEKVAANLAIRIGFVVPDVLNSNSKRSGLAFDLDSTDKLVRYNGRHVAAKVATVEVINKATGEVLLSAVAR